MFSLIQHLNCDNTCPQRFSYCIQSPITLWLFPSYNLIAVYHAPENYLASSTLLKVLQTPKNIVLMFSLIQLDCCRPFSQKFLLHLKSCYIVVVSFIQLDCGIPCS
ncbi:hypothetical protein CDAR_230911 [Caerostris darwini]|uniref:Uncharacterized protein n=1 Tax=Caerostris darwini TaxID=1538125 RepID=A0AAV4S6H9_9ARAC|nr:hypothetical protein CDAR_230911 [Caerostris darwini]